MNPHRGHAMKPNWLQEYLDDAIGRKVCTKIGCTTCGAADFRTGVLSALANASNMEKPPARDANTAQSILKALAAVEPPAERASDYFDAARLLIYDAVSIRGVEEKTAAEILKESWAGRVFAAMQSHDRELTAARLKRRQFERADAVAARREAKRAKQQQAIRERLEKKAEIDRIWRVRTSGEGVPKSDDSIIPKQ